MKPLILTTYYPPEANAASVRMSQIVKRFTSKDIEGIRVIAFNPLYKYEHEKDVHEQEKVDVIRYARRILPAFVFIPQSLNPLTLIFWIYISLKEIAKSLDIPMIDATKEFKELNEEFYKQIIQTYLKKQR